MDSGCAPSRIFFRQAPDKYADFSASFRSAPTRSGPPPPAQPKSRPVPADHGLRLHHDQDVCPPGPNASQSSPEQPVPGIQSRMRSLAFQDGDLLPQGQDLQGSLLPTAEKDSYDGQESKDELEHES